MFQSVTLEVIGDQRLSCEKCERRAANLLAALPGVRQVRARALDQRIHVLFDPAVLDDAVLAARLDAGGYRTRVIG